MFLILKRNSPLNLGNLVISGSHCLFLDGKQPLNMKKGRHFVIKLPCNLKEIQLYSLLSVIFLTSQSMFHTNTLYLSQTLAAFQEQTTYHDYYVMLTWEQEILEKANTRKKQLLSKRDIILYLESQTESIKKLLELKEKLSSLDRSHIYKIQQLHYQ